MARRRQSSFFEDLMDLVSMLPWWAGLMLGLVSYLWLHHVATQPIVASPADIKQLSDSVANQLWRTMAILFQYVFPIVCIIGSAISAFKQYKKSKDAGGDLGNTSLHSSRSTKFSIDAPDCPVCGSSMVKRTTRKGQRAGESFWGCPKYPGCRGTRATT